MKLYHRYIGELSNDRHEFTITQLYSERKRAGCTFTSGANCVDFETEALTQRGWVKGPDLLMSDTLLTKNATTGALEWQQPTAINLFPNYEGPLVELSSTRFSAVTTPDHRWLVNDHKTGESKCVVTSKLSRNGDHRIHRTGRLEAPDAPHTDDFLELAGWLLTDGNISKEGGSTRISLFQTKPDNVSRIDTLFERMGLSPTRYGRGERGAVVWHLSNAPRGKQVNLSTAVRDNIEGKGCAPKGYTVEDYLSAGMGVERDLVVAQALRISLPAVRFMRKKHGIARPCPDGKGVASRLREMFPERILTAGFVATLSRRQAQHLVAVMLLGDGTKTNTSDKFFTKHEASADAVQMLLVLAGQASSATWRDMSGYEQKQYPSMKNIPTMTGIWNVNLYKRDTVQVQKHQVREFTEARGVWCPSVPNTYFVARRNKTVYITGNTFFQGLAADGAKLAGWMIMRECYLERPYEGLRYEKLLPEVRGAVDLLRLEGESPLYGSRPIVFAHDENIAESEEAKAPEAADRLSKVMVECMQIYTPKVKIRSEATITRRWLKGAKSIRDENGRLQVWAPKPKK